MAMDGKDGEPLGPRQKDKSLPGHDIFCTPENSNFLSNTPYKTLDPTQREIRLLKVLPDSGSGFLECELLPNAPIAELRGKYLALSYCAGNPRNTEVILVNGIKCNVFANLSHALTRARHFWTMQPGDDEFLLWADQICINQADLSERSHQVGFMRDIYQSAQQTLICLSTSNTEGRGMKWFVENHGDEDGHWRQHSTSEVTSGDLTVEMMSGEIAFYKEVIGSPWWERAWVFQEFMVSAHATFLSGNHHICWMKARLAVERDVGLEPNGINLNMICQDLNCWPGQSSGVMEIMRQSRKVMSMLKAKAKWKGNNSLTSFLGRSWDSKASDDRDRIYAFIGIAHPGYGIIPDYSADKTLCHVLTEATRNIILFENRLDALAVLREPSAQTSRNPELPSWVVDWRDVRLYLPGDQLLNEALQKGEPIATFRETTHPETLQETTVMEVKGIFVNGYTTGTCTSETWYLGGLPHSFCLDRESYGYRIRECINPAWFDPDTIIPRIDSEELAAAEPRVISIF